MKELQVFEWKEGNLRFVNNFFEFFGPVEKLFSNNI